MCNCVNRFRSINKREDVITGGYNEKGGRRSLGAVVADAAHLDFDLFLPDRLRDAPALLTDQSHVVHALNITTIGANEVRMAVVAFRVLFDQLKTPNVVSEVSTRNEPSLRKIHQISIDGGPIDREVGDMIPRSRDGQLVGDKVLYGE